MNLIITIPLAIGAYALYKAVANTKDAAGKIQVTNATVSDIVVTLFETKMKLGLTLTNPTNTQLKVTQLQANIFCCNSKIGSINLIGQNITIPAKQQITVTLPLSLSNAGNVQALIYAIQSAQTANITVSGYVVANGFHSEFSQETQIF